MELLTVARQRGKDVHVWYRKGQDLREVLHAYFLYKYIDVYYRLLSLANSQDLFEPSALYIIFVPGNLRLMRRWSSYKGPSTCQR